MTQLDQVYKCSVCGNIVTVIHAGVGQLVCCGQPMQLQKENITDAAREKHVPVIEKTTAGVKIKIGSVPHPMTEEHRIEWIEVMTADQVYRQYLKAGEKPEAEFNLGGEQIVARAYCNLHGLWQS